MKAKILMLVVAAMLLVGSAVPALATHDGRSGGPDVEPVCGWDWDRYLWRAYEYELWYWACDYGEDGWNVYAFWNPDYGYWYP